MAMTEALSGHERHVAEINIIPLADVLLVLLIIFMVTAPTATRAIDLDLPARDDRVQPTPVHDVSLRIDDAGDVYRGGELIPMHMLQATLEAEFRGASAKVALSIHASDEASYEQVAQVLASAQRAGIAQIGFTARR